MDIFTDFDASYSSDYYSAIDAGNGNVDIFDGATKVSELSPNENSVTDGDIIFHSANVEGGVDTFVNGTLQNHTQPNIYGGEDFYDGSEIKHTTIPNEHGGQDIYDGNFQHEGTTFPNTHGNEDYLANFSAQGNVDEILSYSDPLKHIQNLRPDPFYI